MTIGKQIALVAGFLCIIIAGLTGFTVIRITQLNQISDSIVLDSLPGLIYSAKIKSLLAENQIRCNRFLLAKTAEERKTFREEISVTTQEILDAIKRYEGTVNDEVDRRNYEKLKSAREVYVKNREEFLTVAETNQSAGIEFLTTKLSPSYIEYTKAGEILEEFNASTGEAHGKELAAGVKSDIRSVIFVGMVGLLVGVISSFFVIRRISSGLHEVARALSERAVQVASAAGQVSGSSQSLAEGASEQAASLEETSSSLEEMSSMTKRNADNANNAKELAKQTRHSADAGAQDMDAMNTAMNAIKDASSDIAKIIKTIDEIAFQTNILALNAAVEAARAGEAGMGFAVVAEEVRNLAQRSAQAAKETSAKIEGAITKAEQGVHISTKVAAGLHDIVSKIRKVDDLVAEVAAASQEQRQGIDQVNVAVSEMDKVTQSNAAGAEESASAAEELTGHANGLKVVVQNLLTLVGAQHLAEVQATKTIKADIDIHPPVTPATTARKLSSNGNLRPSALLSARDQKDSGLPMDDDFES